MPAKRVVALVLPELLCELASEVSSVQVRIKHAPGKKLPLAVVLNPDQTAKLDAVNRVARSYGVSVGQTVVEANAFLAHLVVCHVPMSQVQAALARVAEVAMKFGRVVSVEPQTCLNGRSAPDTVWIDITGAAHLRGGEQELAEELQEQVHALGHVVRVGIASGKHLAQAFARWSTSCSSRGVCVVPPHQTKKTLAGLPVLALPLEKESTSWLVRLGVLSIEDLLALPRKSAVSRLGPEAEHVLDLCEGNDRSPLVAYQPAHQFSESKSWEEPATGVEPLSFALRGLASRISARLGGRGEAAQVLKLSIQLDKSIAELRRVPSIVELQFELAAPLWREHDLLKVLTSRIERLELQAPSLGIRCFVSSIVPAVERQLELSRVAGGIFSATRGVEELPVLLAELNADIGPENLGVLQLDDEHLIELKSVLVPTTGGQQSPQAAKRQSNHSRKAPAKHQRQPSSTGGSKALGQSKFRSLEPRSELRKTRATSLAAPGLEPRDSIPPQQAECSGLGLTPTRLLPQPVRLRTPLKPGRVVSVGEQLCKIEALKFEYRLEAVKWWDVSVSRDYFKVLFKGPNSVFEALVYVERDSGRRYLQAILD